MGARTKGRRRATDVLYAADVRGVPVAEILAQEASRAEHEPERATSWAFARQILLGVGEHRDEIDELLTTYSRGWPLDRMPAVDRAILRVGVWELRWSSDVPPSVAITEAVESAKTLSTEDSGRFVHGVLGRIAELPTSP
ncbi:N utilization substance protein B [Pseudoclavibacter endophyticus]|uniref:Transcription antitermination protein NusB n=1 Tax=Pseudoclavibacter endophyticus TaxID=1778590 RepID=A0A6H9WTS8_9MICO|nr:transcription antitermination factor NusB [Pseudoclavibacter endophyticus]KAB1650085.1 transcription antitermination factor NusB [Pseudoclavibacter endophyticus]GGA57407.1 N utilization substance protein B [Pseudoclavibacter endophyticus]